MNKVSKYSVWIVILNKKNSEAKINKLNIFFSLETSAMALTNVKKKRKLKKIWTEKNVETFSSEETKAIIRWIEYLVRS